MNSNSYIEEQIQCINEKISLIEDHVATIDSVVPYFDMMGDYIETLKSIYEQFDDEFDYTLFRLNILNVVVLDEFINDYEVITKQLFDDCSAILEEFNSIKASIAVSKLGE